jgi:nucleoside-diphosphate-sugar epimerase
MRIVVTGGCGFIGSHLVRRLLERGDDVHVVDIAGRRIDGAVVHLASVLDTSTLAPILRGAEVVVHLAGFVREQMRRDPAAGRRLQVEGTRNLLEASERVGVARFILASSFYVYAGNPRESVDEDEPIDRDALEPFALAKLASEMLCRDYAARDGVEYTILRLGSAYGPGGSNAVRAFFEVGLRGEPIEVWGDGRRRNQYTYVGDLASGIVATIERPGESGGQVFNLVAPTATATGELAEILAAEFGFAITHGPQPAGGPSFPYMRSDKASGLLGWRTLPLVDGLRLTARELFSEFAVAK